MLKDFAKLILTAKALADVLKEKVESKTAHLALQVKAFQDNAKSEEEPKEQKCILKEKAKEDMSQFFNEINHKAQINELQLKGFIKDKLIELTNNALLDSTELNDIRADIASLRAEVADIKTQIQFAVKR